MNDTNPVDLTIFTTLRWLYTQWYEGKLWGKGSSNKVFFTVGVSLPEVAWGDNVFQNYYLFNEEGKYVLTTNKQKVRVEVWKDNYSSLTEKQQKFILDFISKIFNV